MSTQEIFAIAAILTGLINWYGYIRSILIGQTQPHLFTWLIWVLTGSIAAAAQISDNAGPAVWASCGAVIYFLSVFVLSIRYGSRAATRADWLSLIAAIASLPLWLVLDDPLAAVLLVTLIDTLGFIPTIRKTWHAPYSEHLASYGWAAARLSFTLLALENITLVTALYQASFLVCIIGFVAMTLWRRYRIAKAKDR